MSTKRPCQAQDPSTCPYHGTVIKMNQAVLDGRIDDYVTLRTQVEKMDAERAKKENLQKVVAKQKAASSILKRAPHEAREWSQSLEKKYGVTLFLSGGRVDDWVVLSKIIIPKEQRSAGIGTKVMNEICAEADRNGWKVGLTPDGEYGGTVSRLNKFYARFGFVPNKGRNRDFTTRETFIRVPS